MTSRTPLRRSSGIAAKALIARAISFFLSKRLMLSTTFSPFHSAISFTLSSSGASTATHGYTTRSSTCFSRRGHVRRTTPLVNSELTATPWAKPMLQPSSRSKGAR